MYALFRTYDPAMTRSQLDGIALASLASLDTYVYRGGSSVQLRDHGIRWVRSYWEEGGTWGACVYEAPEADVLAVYQDLCGLPFRSMEEVVELPGPAAAPGGRPLAVELRVDPGADPAERAAALAESDASLIRVYWNAAARHAFALFDARDEPAAKSRLAAGAARPPASVVEITPDDYR
jgi:hypothetical protein